MVVFLVCFVCLANKTKPGTMLVTNEICEMNKFLHEHVASSAKSEGIQGPSLVLKILIGSTVLVLLTFS